MTTLIAALLHHNIELVFATVPLAGALLGFLRFNFNPASIFLGDCGSLTLGFLLGCYGIVWSEKSTTLLGISAPLFSAFGSTYGCRFAIGRRFLRQKPIFGADRAHIHHKLLSRGLTTRRVVLVLYGMCGLGAAASLVLAETRAQYQGFVFVLLFPAAVLGLRYLGYKEFSVAGKLALDGSFQRQINAHLALLEFEEALSGSVTLDQCSTVLCSTCTEFGFSGVEIRLDGVVRHRKSSQGLACSHRLSRPRLHQSDSRVRHHNPKCTFCSVY